VNVNLDLAAIVRQLEDVRERHPNTAVELEPVIRALTSDEASTIGTEQARKLLGVRSVNTVKRWIEIGMLAGQWDERAGRWRIPLAEVLRLRATQQSLTDVGGEDLSQDELDDLADSRRGTYPWQRRGQS